MRVALTAAWLAVCLAWPWQAGSVQVAQAPDSGSMVHSGLPYGSQSLFNPATVLLNKGFDIVQLSKSSRNIWSYPVGTGFTHFIPDIVLRPWAAVERDPGWEKWLRTEVLFLSFGDARWVVNWTEHLLGGGVTHRGLTDWYATRGVPHPKLVAGVTTMVAAALNEVTEHPGYTQGASSSVADLWIFDLGGVLLFSWDRPARWAVEHLQMADWSNIASFTVPGLELENNGQYLVMKPPLPFDGKRLFVRFGLGVQFGLTSALDAEHSLSVAFGLDTAGRRLDPRTGRESIEMEYGGGVYFDRNNSLLASLVVADDRNQVVLNLYPGLGGGALRDVGAWIIRTEGGAVRVGLVHRWAGVGLGSGG